MRRALMQMTLDGPREPVRLVPIAVGDYLRFGLRSGWALFRAMVAFPTLDRIHGLQMPTLVVAGRRDPLVRIERVDRFSGLPHVRAVVVPGAHALNFSSPELISALVEAHLTGAPLAGTGPLHDVVEVAIPPA
jgi:pimeloyl-ACP methyl ester carboxylesterase